MTTQRTAPGRGAEGEAKNLVGTGSFSSLLQAASPTNSDMPHCRICKRPLFAARSCRRSIGPKCAARIAALMNLAGWRVELVVEDDNGNAVALVLVPLAEDT